MTDRTARNFMHVAETFKSETVSNFSPKVLYALSAPNTPPEVREKVEARVASGEKVSLDGSSIFAGRRIKPCVEGHAAITLPTSSGHRE
jgi:hypothetical protein